MKVIFLFGLSLLLTACTSENQLSPLNTKQPILAFGDSLTFGYGAPSNQSYPAQLSELLDIEVINAGISGEQSKAGLARLENLLDRYEPQLLILCHGANDMLKKKSLETMQKNVGRMIELAQQRDIQVVLISVPEASLFLPDIEQYQVLAERYNVPIENEIIKNVVKKASLRSDMIHPNAAGYKLIAEAIYTLLEENGAL